MGNTNLQETGRVEGEEKVLLPMSIKYSLIPRQIIT